jgi:PhzF family phenazine biosynthesis protein
MSVQVQLIKAFTKNPEMGNPAGVLLDSQGLSDEQMQAIATDLGFSESVFITPSDKADYKTRFFAPKVEVDYCGHATVAAFSALFDLPENLGKSSLMQEARAGIFLIEKTEDGKIMMLQKNPAFGVIEERRDLVSSILGVEPGTLHPSLPIQVVATNVAKLMVPFKSVELLDSIKPDFGAMTEFIKSQEGKGLYCFAPSEEELGSYVARFFNPAVGINEDAATGVAAGPLGAYLNKYIYNGTCEQLKILQGKYIGKPSELFVDLTDGVRVGGFAAGFGVNSYS